MHHVISNIILPWHHVISNIILPWKNYVAYYMGTKHLSASIPQNSIQNIWLVIQHFKCKMIHRAGSSNEIVFFSVAKLLKSAADRTYKIS